MMMNQLNTAEYAAWLVELKKKISSAQLRAAVAVNRELLSLYWEIGKFLSAKSGQANWGAAIVEKLARDLRAEFPDQQGFSRTNLFSMRKWYEFYRSPDEAAEKIQQLVGQIPWRHNVLIISKAQTLSAESPNHPFSSEIRSQTMFISQDRSLSEMKVIKKANCANTERIFQSEELLLKSKEVNR